MATINAPGYTEYAHDGPDGVNVASLHQVTVGAADGDTLRVCRLAAGTRVVDLSVLTANDVIGLTAGVGYEAVDDGDTDADAFIVTGSDVATAGRLRANAPTLPGVFAQDAYLTVTVAGAALTDDAGLAVLATIQTVGL